MILLPSKLTAPHLRPLLVARPPLHHLLGRAPTTRLTTLIAPAGFGKSTAVAHWLAQHPHLPHGWLTVDEDDNDLGRFLSYFLAALGRLTPAPRAHALLAGGATAEAVLAAVLEEAPSTEAALLVLDDVHLLTQPAVQAAVGWWLEHQPAHWHTIALSRTPLPLPVARWRAQGQLLELTPAHLRFSAAETAELLNQHNQLHLTAAEIAHLAGQTEGWVAGLQLAALALTTADAPPTAAFLASFDGTHQHIADYLLEEAFRQQTAEMQQFLLLSAVPDQFCAALCHAMAPHLPLPDPSQLLHLFVVPLDAQREWFRYHHLMRDFLRQRGRALWGTAVWQTHVRRVAHWLEAHNNPAEAMRHWLAAGATAKAEALFVRLGLALFISGQTELVVRWLAAMPEPAVRRNPILAMGRAIILSNQFLLAESEQYFQLAEQALADWPTADSQLLRGQIAAGRAGNANLRGDVAHTLAHATTAEALLAPEDWRTRSTVALSMGFAQVAQGEITAALHTFHHGAALAERSESWHIYLMCQSQLGYLHLVRGEPASVRHIGQAVAALRQRQILVPMMGLIHTGMAALAWEELALDEALAEAQEGVRLCQAALNPQALLATYLNLVQAHVVRGELAQAQEALTAAEQIVHRLPHEAWLAEIVAASRACVATAAGELRPALAWLDGVQVGVLPHGETANSVLLILLESIQLEAMQVTLVAHAQQARERAAWHTVGRVLRPHRQAADRAGWLYHAFKLLVVEALAEHHAGRTAEGQALLARALAVAEPRGYVHSVVRWGELIRPLLAAASPAPFVRRLLAQVEPQTAVAEPLTPREGDVVRLIVAGLTNEQIAAELHITYGTTKRHVNNIYSKLGVSHRAQAIRKAQELGW